MTRPTCRPASSPWSLAWSSRCVTPDWRRRLRPTSCRRHVTQCAKSPSRCQMFVNVFACRMRGLQPKEALCALQGQVEAAKSATTRSGSPLAASRRETFREFLQSSGSGARRFRQQGKPRNLRPGRLPIPGAQGPSCGSSRFVDFAFSSIYCLLVRASAQKLSAPFSADTQIRDVVSWFCTTHPTSEPIVRFRPHGGSDQEIRRTKHEGQLGQRPGSALE
jgi:hypothetical protein